MKPRTDDGYGFYEEAGLLYDSVPSYHARNDMDFYVARARGAGGPVLEIGCGTGRILLASAEAGATVTGLDGSEVLLARCQEKLALLPDEVRRRVSTHHGDARDFDLGGQFALITSPFRVFQHMTKIEDQLRALASIKRHLAPGGTFIFDVFNPSFERLVSDRSAEQDETPPQPLPDGRTFRRNYRITRVRWLDQVNETDLIYYVSDGPGTPEKRYVHHFDMRWYLKAEMEHLLARAGFEIVEALGDFGGGPLTDGAWEQIWVVRHAR